MYLKGVQQANKSYILKITEAKIGTCNILKTNNFSINIFYSNNSKTINKRISILKL